MEKEALVYIDVEAHCAANEALYLAGNLPQLGEWGLEKAQLMVKVS
jgi:hypothetical protein